MDIKLINELLNELIINKAYIDIETIKSSNELLETLKIIENCTSCKEHIIKKIYFDKLIYKIKSYLIVFEEMEQYIINQLVNELIKINDELNRKVLCECCKEKKIEKLNYKCGNE